MKPLRLDNKVIVISSGTKGVGKAAAVAFAAEGAKIVFGGRDENSAKEVLRSIEENNSEGVFVYTDLKNISSCALMFETAVNRYGKVDGLFNYAGITPISSLETCDEQTFDDVMSINFKAAFFCCQNAVNYMKDNGGSIVLTGSAHAWGGQKDRAAYACSKGALITLMEHISHNYAVEKIRCNYLTLGWTPTEGELQFRESLGESEKQLRSRASKVLPMGRMCEPNDYIEGLIYLMSDQSKMMTGSIFRITAGEYI